MPTPIDPKAPLVVTTLTPVFARLFDRDALLLEARRLGAVKRDRMQRLRVRPRDLERVRELGHALARRDARSAIPAAAPGASRSSSRTMSQRALPT